MTIPTVSTTFHVDSVTPEAGYRLQKTLTPTEIFAALKESNIEGCEANLGNLSNPHMNPFVGALHQAYQSHLPLTLSPDDVWTTITQGLAIHVNKNAEALRHHFVDFAGKKDIEVEMPGFVKGGNNPWKDSLNVFSSEIAKFIGRKRDLLVSAFTTTGPVEQAASEVVLMGAMKEFFEYYGSTLCGIPTVTLLGTVEDWRSVRRRAGELAQFDLEWWTKELLPVLDQFVNAAEGNVDGKFWKNLYKVSGGSGGPFITGWINTFFPYVVSNYPVKGDLVVSRHLSGVAGGSMHSGNKTNHFPMGLTRVPWTWKYNGVVFKMEFLGGFVAVSQDPATKGVRPAMGWAVRDVG